MAYIVSVLIVSVRVINTGDIPNPNAKKNKVDFKSNQAETDNIQGRLVNSLYHCDTRDMKLRYFTLNCKLIDKSTYQR